MEIFTEQQLEEITDRIATYLEIDEIWDKLKRDTWLVSGRSEELRRMIREGLARDQRYHRTYLTPSEVRTMTPEQVRENYNLIIESMKLWN